MIVKMSLLVAAYIFITVVLWKFVKDKAMTNTQKVLIGLIYGICAILSTHFGVDYIHMMLNVRDLGPLIAGIYFHPISGIIAGVMGGVERYIAGTYFGVGSFTRLACSISTLLAGIIAAMLNKYAFKGNRPSPAQALFIGAVMEIFHMYVVIVTHRDDMTMAFYVVDACSIPMIVFSALGLASVSIAWLVKLSGFRNVFKRKKESEIPISHKMQKRIFIVMCVLMLSNIVGTFYFQNQTASQSAAIEMNHMVLELKDRFVMRERVRNSQYIGSNGQFSIYDNAGRIVYGVNKNKVIDIDTLKFLKTKIDGDIFEYKFFGDESICRVISLGSEFTGIICISTNRVFWYRNAQTYEAIFYAILMIAAMYWVISIIVDRVVVNNIHSINDSLERITNGNLDEIVKVENSKEFALLSSDINKTVASLKDYINREKSRMEKELELASSIQMSSLPKNFKFHSHPEFEMYALMDAAKEVGGDFYDFFFVSTNNLAMVIADVSGKGIPGALFMMRAKAAIRSFAQQGLTPADVFYQTNNFLCEGNDNDLFVTAWFGILDLETGIIKCVNFGHEYPIILRINGKDDIYMDAHSLPLAACEETAAKEYEIKLNVGEGIFLYTDGVPEAINKRQEAYGMDRLIKVLNNNKSCTIKRILQTVRSDVSEFVGDEEQFDDITLFAIRLMSYARSHRS